MTNNASPYAATMISKKSPNPEAAMQFLNWQYDPGKDNVLTAVYGIPGQAWDWVDANEKYYVDRFETDAGQIYAGEFMIATGLGTDTWFAPNTEDLKRHYEEHYLPIYGIVIAFKDISPFSSVADVITKPFVDFKWFKQLFEHPDGELRSALLLHGGGGRHCDDDHQGGLINQIIALFGGQPTMFLGIRTSSAASWWSPPCGSCTRRR